MTTNHPSSVPVQPSQYNSMLSAQPLDCFDNLPGVDSAGNYPAVDYVNPPPPTRYTSTGSVGYYDPPHPATGSAEQRRNQSQFDGHTPGITQCNPIAPGPPRFEQYGPPIPEVPNDCAASHIPLPLNIAGADRGNASIVHPRVSATDDLKNMASHYLHNPGSRIDKLRIRRSRSGAVKVLILLEVDDTM
ncbi:hypothetical protein DFH94DRAFT_405090 [Russula ochroleuca]|uniref:Uncharacterized protein n=1 Tax=Russula ochroleuca TaxID=152965 RepID=A0A9P5MY52_9AGAM|nr:hypothetical protein DFH94DRAFT_405090 [Russula ochroleuca]